MNRYGRIVAYLYVIGLLFWHIAIVQGDFYRGESKFLCEVHSPSKTANDKVSSLGHLHLLFLGSPNYSSFFGNFPLDHHFSQSHFFHEGAFQYRYLESLHTAALSSLRGVDLKFEFVDLIFPYHYFF